MKIPLDHKADRKLLVELCSHLKVSKNNIRKDELDYWNIIGKEVWIDTDSLYWYIHISTTSERKWKNCKEALSWMELRIDGDDEGVLRSDKMPDETQSRVIRKLLKLRESNQPPHLKSYSFPAPTEG